MAAVQRSELGRPTIERPRRAPSQLAAKAITAQPIPVPMMK
jgi:hypothetical protein